MTPTRSRTEELARRGSQITKWVVIAIVMAFLLNAAVAFLDRSDANAASRHHHKCPKGHSSMSKDRYWSDSDPFNNFRLGEINIKAHACYGGHGRIKKSSAHLYVRTNGMGTAEGYEIYRLPGNDYVHNHKHGLIKVYYRYMQYHQCLVPFPGGGLLCNHTGTVRFEITIYSKKAMHRLGKYAPQHRILWLWMPMNDWADDHFELWATT